MSWHPGGRSAAGGRRPFLALGPSGGRCGPGPRAKADVERLEVRHAAARARLDAVEITTRGAREAHAECQAVLVASRAEVRRLESELSGQPSLHELESGEVAALRALEDAKASCETQRSRFQGEGGTLAARRFREERAALEQLETRRTTARSEAERCRVRLEQRADEGLYSKLVKARVVAWETEQAAAHATRSAQIARRTHRHLGCAARAAVGCEPVRRVVQDGVALLFPGSTLALMRMARSWDCARAGWSRPSTTSRAVPESSWCVGAAPGWRGAGGGASPRSSSMMPSSTATQSGARMVEVLRRASDHLQLLVFPADEDFDRLAADFHVRVEAAAPRVLIPQCASGQGAASRPSVSRRGSLARERSVGPHRPATAVPGRGMSSAWLESLRRACDEALRAGPLDMRVGIPKESRRGENRVAAVPDRRVIARGFEVYVEADAVWRPASTTKPRRGGRAHRVHRRGLGGKRSRPQGRRAHRPRAQGTQAGCAGLAVRRGRDLAAGRRSPPRGARSSPSMPCLGSPGPR